MHIKYLIISMVIVLAGCSTSNKVLGSWKNPEATLESIKFQTVTVFGMVKDQELRRDVEEAIASQMVNTIVVPSYKLISNDQLIWYGESTSVNPEGIQQTISELAVSVKNQLVEDGLLDPTQ